ncbi:LytTR family DNA-binding domain-containing protein [Vibrio ishigakensis]|uniref:LytTR family DNA-binding domain-containing protein n=1 Tax=Vibrio ishigakensis TaxID=1481914 RepID=UPI0021C341F6|nr:LytTR family DNA-binding domain-containing protein [Vibrio ishigakensis]
MKGQIDIGDVSPSKYFFAIASLLGFLFAFIVPSPDSAWGFGLSIVQWQLQTLGPMATILVCHLALSRLAKFESLNPWFKLFISGAFGALFFSPVALCLDTIFMAEKFTDNLLTAWINELSNVAPPAVICWLAINSPWVLGLRLQTLQSRAIQNISENESVERQNIKANTSLEPTSAYLDWPFMNLLPESIQDRPIYLKSELHYLLVVTPKGKSLILYNLSDAISEMGESMGYQPHRSYWVANDATKSFVRKGRQGELILNNGESIPVSRRNLEFVAALQSNADSH